MHKNIEVTRLTAATNVTAVNVSTLLDEAGVKCQPIDVVDWKESYPYQPEVSFRIAHTGDKILVEYNVREKSVRAVAGEDNGRVWEDSCCEFFFAPTDDGLYYNVEANCIGRVHVGCGTGRGALRQSLPNDLIATIDRCSTLGTEPFDERKGDCSWRMTLVIPVQLFCRHDIKSLDGLHGHCNFYKCGDLLETPHFLSWNRIEVDKPDFHRSDFFGDVTFLPESGK